MKNQSAVSARLGVLTVVLTLVGWASVPLFIRHFAHSIDVWTSNGWRYGFSALVWLPVLLIVMARTGLPKGLWRAALIPSIVNAAGQVCFAWAHYRIEPGLLTFGLRTQLLFVAIGAWLMFPTERAIIRKPGYIIGAIVLLLGMTAVILMGEPARMDDAETSVVLSDSSIANPQSSIATGLASPSNKTAYIEGVALALASGLLFAGYGLSVRKYMHGVNSILAFAAICQYTAIVMVGLMVAFGIRRGAVALDMPSNQIMWLLISALIGIAIGHVFYYFSIARLGVAVTAGVLQLQPFLVAIASMALFKEVLNGWQWLGGTIAVCGALLMLGVQWRLSQRAIPGAVIEEPVAIAEGEGGS